MNHTITAKTELGRDIIRVECACGYYQQVRPMAFFPSLWLRDEQHLEWFAQNQPKPHAHRYVLNCAFCQEAGN